MTKQIYIIFLILFIVNIWATAQDWQLVWSDEFDYTDIPDSTKWSFDVEGNAWDWGNNELQNYTPVSKGNARVENGHLIIEARKEKWTYPGDGQERDYTSARLRTINKGDWCYCKVEVRAKLPGGRGTWPAIWMLPTDNAYGTWPKSGELDIMENVGFDPDRVHFTIHTEAYNHMNGTQQGANTLLNDPVNNFNTYSMEWFEDHTDFYANDDKIFTFENEGTGYAVWPFDKRFHLLLNIAIGGSWGGQQGVDTTIFPVRMTVDYVRVYQENVNTNPNNLQNDNKSKVKIATSPDSKNSIVTFSLPSGNTISIKVFKVNGTQISHNVYDFQKAGTYSIPLQINCNTLSSGVYFLLFRTEGEIIKKKFIIKR